MQPTSKKTVTKMRDAYERTIRKASTENLKKKYPERSWLQEAASAWVSRKELEEFLNANNADGLRIYYGCHHESTSNDPKLDYLGLHNLIFVATRASDTQNPTSETSVDHLTIDDGEPLTYDGAAATDMALCPPICPPPPPPPQGE